MTSHDHPSTAKVAQRIAAPAGRPEALMAGGCLRESSGRMLHRYYGAVVRDGCVTMPTPSGGGGFRHACGRAAGRVHAVAALPATLNLLLL